MGDLGERQWSGTDGDARKDAGGQSDDQHCQAEQSASANGGNRTIFGNGLEIISCSGLLAHDLRSGPAETELATESSTDTDRAGGVGVAERQTHPPSTCALPLVAIAVAAVPDEQGDGHRNRNCSEHDTVGLTTAVVVTKGVDTVIDPTGDQIKVVVNARGVAAS